MNSIKTENIFIKKIKETLLSDNYKNINVNALCKDLGLKRQTFYYHYRDLSDLIYYMLLAEDIGDIREIKCIEEMTLKLINFFDKNRILFNRLLELNADSSIECFVYESFYNKFSILLMNKYKDQYSIKEINFLNYLMSSYISKLIMYYFSINLNFNIFDFQKYVTKMTKGIESKFLENLR